MDVDVDVDMDVDADVKGKGDVDVKGDVKGKGHQRRDRGREAAPRVVDDGAREDAGDTRRAGTGATGDDAQREPTTDDATPMRLPETGEPGWDEEGLNKLRRVKRDMVVREMVERSVAVDRARMRDGAALPPGAGAGVGAGVRGAQRKGFSPRTELLREVEARVALRGPISVAEFMRVALTHPTAGYYASRDAEAVLGPKGDFTTSPEISQLFGEMLAVWMVQRWIDMGRPSAVRVVEFGPGKGTLMKDALRTFASFPDFASALKAVHLVEVSEKMRAAQAKALGVDAGSSSAPSDTKFAPLRNSPHGKVPVEWSNSGGFDDIPGGEPLLVFAQEFLDALPVHQFELTEKGWSERLVDVAPSSLDGGDDDPTQLPDLDGLKHHLRFVLSPGATPAVRTLLRGVHTNRPPRKEDVGARVEVGPDALAWTQDLSRALVKRGGGAVVVDYGKTESPIADSLRGIREHKFVHPLSQPGLVDLSVDVDFPALARIAKQSVRPGSLVVGGPTTQGEFLTNLGIQHRVAVLLRKLEAANDDEAKLRLFAGYKRLVGTVPGEGMGSVFKVLAFGAPVPSASATATASASTPASTSEPRKLVMTKPLPGFAPLPSS